MSENQGPQLTINGELVPSGWTQLEDQDETGFSYEYIRPFEHEPFPHFVTTYQPEDGMWTVEAYLSYPMPGESDSTPDAAHLLFGYAETIELVDLFRAGYMDLLIYLHKSYEPNV